MLHGRKTDLPFECFLDKAFRQQVQKHGDKPALLTDDHQITFNELDHKSDAFAAVLRQKIGNTDQPVIIAMSGSMDRFVVILALFKLRIPYVPVEKCLPRNRIKIMIRETKACCMIFDEELEELVNRQEFFCDTVLMKFEVLKRLAENLERVGVPLKENGNEDRVSCILYTSGSTGVPKGVQLTHSNIMCRLNWQWKEFPFEGDEVGLAKTSLLFVDSISEAWSFLLQGKPVVVANKESVHNPEALVNTLVQFAVTRLLVVPSLLQSLLTYLRVSSRAGELEKLCMLFSSGESLSTNLAHGFFSIFANKRLVNLYGSTEVSGDATFEWFESVDDVIKKTCVDALSIGKPIDNVTVKLLGDNSEETENDEIGEIWVKGPTVMIGYVNDERNDNFLIDDKQGLWYRTGDYAKVVNGMLIYEGRHDNQVKVRGQRVHLGEIEKAILTIPGIKSVVILAIEHNIVAFCVAHYDTLDEEIKEKCSQFLPEYMVPQVYLLEQIPLTPTSGKVDMIELKRLFKDRNASKKKNAIQTNNNSNSKIQEVIADVIGISTIDLSADVYDNGGNSINIIQIVGRLDELGIKIDFNRFIQARTVEEMIACTQNLVESVPPPIMEQFRRVPLDQNTSKHVVASLGAESSEPELVCRAINTTYEEWYTIFHDLTWEKCLNSGVSALYYRGNEPVALVLNKDVSNPVDYSYLSPAIAIAAELSEFSEGEPKRTLEGPVMDNCLTGVAPTLTGEEKLALMNDMEEYMVERGRELGYKHIVTLNTSPVTQMMAARLGWETIMTLDLRDYVRSDGTKPFENLPRDSIAKTMIKRL